MLKMSTESRYGLRILFDIAYHSLGLPAQVKDISSRQGISPRYVEQICQKLKRAGIILSTRGPLGGYSLAKKIDDISVGEVVRATQREPIQLVNCYGIGAPENRCERVDECVVKDVWAEASSRLISYLDSVTLACLCEEAEKKGIERQADGHSINA